MKILVNKCILEWFHTGNVLIYALCPKNRPLFQLFRSAFICKWRHPHWWTTLIYPCIHHSGTEEQNHRKNVRNFIWHPPVKSANQTGWWGPHSLRSKKCFRHVALSFLDHTEFSGSPSRDQTFPAGGNVKSLQKTFPACKKTLWASILFQHVKKLCGLLSVLCSAIFLREA